MPDFQTFDLGRVLQTAEAIKGLRRASAQDDLQRQYLGTQIAGAQQSQKIQADTAAEQDAARVARQQYWTAQAALISADPKATVESLQPHFVQDFESKHGQGSWAAVTPEQAHAMAQQIQNQAITIIGPQQKVKWIDNGGQQVPVDEVTGQPIHGATAINKTASPDATLSSQTSATNNAATNATTRRGQDITAETARATAGSKVTETQGNAKAFGLRATSANSALEKLIMPATQGGGGYDPLGVGAVKDQAMAGHALTNWASSAKGQQYKNLAMAFIAPILRKESGAAISESEWASAKQLYIPWPGDSKEVLAQKAQNRQDAIQGLSVQAGPGGIPPTQHGSSGGWSAEVVQ